MSGAVVLIVQRTGFVRVPMPSISHRTTSPGTRNCGGSIPMPTPAGVPVALRVMKKTVHYLQLNVNYKKKQATFQITGNIFIQFLVILQ